MEPFEDDKLVTALESLRPAPRPPFTAEASTSASPRASRGARDWANSRTGCARSSRAAP